jgi:hypothetical protein
VTAVERDSRGHGHDPGGIFWINCFLDREGVVESLSARLAQIVLPEAGGGAVRLGSLWEKNPAAVVFLRHYG